MVNPLRSRLFAEAVGALAKTDRIDARMLALLGARLDPAAAPPAGEAMDGLQELVRARQSAVADKTALSNRAGEAETDFLRVELAQLIAEAERHIARLDEEIGRRIDSDERLAERFRILLSIKGVGPIAAMTLLSCLGEIGACSGKGAAMLAGLAPIARDSGDKNGQRRIRGGRAHVRTALYMAAITAREMETLISPPFTNVYVKTEKPPKSPSPPSCEKSSFSQTSSSVKIVSGPQRGLDTKHRCSS